MRPSERGNQDLQRTGQASGRGKIRAVLGIDAAWTTKQPSGVALAVETGRGWNVVAVEPSYQRFNALATSVSREPRPTGSTPNASELLASANALCGRNVDLVAIDMPLSMQPIMSRRASDDAVSRAYGGRKCSTHTPSVLRPGPMSDLLRIEFGRAGYPLSTQSISTPGLIEVYPHPALVELAHAPQRLTYKMAKSRAYWPSLSPSQRRAELLGQWAKIIALLEVRMTGVTTAFEGFERGLSGVDMKSTEDALDAVVCAWVAICALDGKATPFGDQDSAIWIPIS